MVRELFPVNGGFQLTRRAILMMHSRHGHTFIHFAAVTELLLRKPSKPIKYVHSAPYYLYIHIQGMVTLNVQQARH